MFLSHGTLIAPSMTENNLNLTCFETDSFVLDGFVIEFFSLMVPATSIMCYSGINMSSMISFAGKMRKNIGFTRSPS